MHGPYKEILKCGMILIIKLETFEMGEDAPHKLLMPFGFRRRAYPRSGLVQHTVNLTLVLLI